MDVIGLHNMDRYELVRDIGSGNFGVARLMRDKKTRELVAVKYIERGEKVGIALGRTVCDPCLSVLRESMWLCPHACMHTCGHACMHVCVCMCLLARMLTTPLDAPC